MNTEDSSVSFHLVENNVWQHIIVARSVVLNIPSLVQII